MNPLIKEAQLGDIEAIHSLYQRVAAVEGGLARTKDEITTEYVSAFVRKSLENGVILVSIDERTSTVNGEIHCYCPNLKVFSHVLGELTIAVDPDYQGQGIGRRLFTTLLDTVIHEKPEILRVELIARESNVKAIKFYESFGFKKEGRFEKRIRSAGGGFEADIPMAWLRQVDG